MPSHLALFDRCSKASRWLQTVLVGGLVFCGAHAYAALRVDALALPLASHTAETKQAPTRFSGSVTVVELTEMSQAKAALQDEAGARQIGVARDVAQLATASQTAVALRWVPLPNSGHVAALQVKVAGAWGARLGVRWHALPAAAVVRLYTGVQGGLVQEITGAALLERLPIDEADGVRTWWTPDTGPAPVLELVLPPEVDVSELALSIPQLSEIVVPPAQLIAEASAEMGSLKRSSNTCQQDVNCQDSLLELRNSVIRMVYVSAAKTFQCTGTLVNNVRQDKAAYVLTSAHCAKDQAIASTLQTSWFYYSQSCNSEQLYAGNAERYNGARWLASSLANDMTLLELMDTPPDGAVFAGWDAAAQSSGVVVSAIHHPRGDFLKFNRGVLRENASCSVDYEYRVLNCSPGAQPDGGFYRIELSTGSIEGGSSGSALFVDGRIVGTLTGGDSFCPAKGAKVVYGRLDQALHSAFSPWLGEQLVNDSIRLPVYQFYIPQSGASFYTISPQERDSVIASLAGFVNYVGIAFDAAAEQAPGTVAVHRFFNPQVVAHFYTASAAESEYVKLAYPQLHYDGIVWWAPAQPLDGAKAVYRFYQLSTGSHRYTADEAQRDTWRSNADYLYDGLAYYVWAAP
ncbi:MAG: trypsin-like peptidase domain-containing protein [Comamonas sp.]